MIAFERGIATELARRGPITDETFRWLRKAAGIERGDLAQLLGVTPETIAGWEGERRPIDRAAWLLVAAVVLDGVDGPRPMRTRLQLEQRNVPSPSELELELPPGGTTARILGLLSCPASFTDRDIADVLDVDESALRARLYDLASLGLVTPASPDTPDEEQQWLPSTRQAGALLQTAVEAGVDLDAPLPRATRSDRRTSAARTRPPSSTWRVTSS
ncbi:MAG TPA: helix-turn-helix transcriptional regulator [Labilithrix sp.]|nr:helix-turn-helix transcriptional regulator [Labilithrix sp.]